MILPSAPRDLCFPSHPNCLFRMPFSDSAACAGACPSSASSTSSGSDEGESVGSWHSRTSSWLAEAPTAFANCEDAHNEILSLSSVTLSSQFPLSKPQKSVAALAKNIPLRHEKPPLHPRIGRRFSTDLNREEAWERKRELHVSEEDDIDMDDEGYHSSSDDEVDGPVFSDDDDEKVSCLAGVYTSTGDVRANTSLRIRSKPPRRTRTRSLTDEDLEELRGSIDLGFGFSYDPSSKLKNTLPALELYYAINRQYVDSKSCSTPASPHQRAAPLNRTISTGSNGSASSENWRISSPGDDPSQVKTRLRHWAQAVACHIKEGY